MHRILIIIPAYNEGKSLGSVIHPIPKILDKNIKIEILVIDDGSSDSTSSIAKKNRVYLVKHILNRGLGAALGTGFEFARKYNYDYVITMDADGQHQFKDVIKIIRTLINSKDDIVIGSRLLSQNSMPILRKTINRLSNIMTWLLFNIWTTDSQSGLRGFTRSAIQRLNILSQRMEVSSEIFKEIKHLHLRFHEISIDTIYTDYSLNKGQRLSNAPNIVWKLLIQKFT